MIQLLSGAQDMSWLASTHLKGQDIQWACSAVLHGNESGPDRIDLYKRPSPLLIDEPVSFVVCEDGYEKLEVPTPAGKACLYKTARFTKKALDEVGEARTYCGYVSVRYLCHQPNGLHANRQEPIYAVMGKDGTYIGDFYEGALQDFVL